MNITEIVLHSDTTPGRIFDWAVIGLIVASISTITLDTLPDLSLAARAMIDVSEVIIVGLFILEYCLRVATATRKSGYIFSFFGIIDFMAFVPFVLSAGAVDPRVIRIVRLLRVLRILKLTRCSRAMERFGKAAALAKEEIVLFLAVTLMLLYLSAFGRYHFEHSVQPEAFPSIMHSLWWATATLTTVGYGDVYPITAGGKLFTFVMLMCGLGIVAVPAGLVATALSKVRLDEDRREFGSGEPIQSGVVGERTDKVKDK